jgi:hypothetical protein
MIWAMAQKFFRYAFGFALVLYTVVIVVLQKQQLYTSQNITIDDSPVIKTGEFPGQSSKVPNGMHNVTVEERWSSDTNTVLSYRPASLILQNPKLPDWAKHYVAWHIEQRARFLDAKRNNSSSADGVKFLIYRCLKFDRCGGASDRLQDLPYKVMVANQTNRVLLVIWEKPVQLETFLVPPEDGIDWSMQGEIGDMLKKLQWNKGGDEHNSSMQIVSSIRMNEAAPLFRKYETDVLGHKM